MNPTIGTPMFQTGSAGQYTGSTGYSPQQLSNMVMGGTPSATMPGSSLSGLGQIGQGIGDIFGDGGRGRRCRPARSRPCRHRA